MILFFTLSGMVLTLPFSGPRSPAYSSYLTKRICRLYLPYAAALLLTVAVRLYAPSPVSIGEAWIDGTWNTPVTAKTVLNHLSGIGNFNTLEFNGAYWTIVVEMRVALIMPMIAWCALRLRLIPGLAISLLCSVFFAWLSPHLTHKLISSVLEFVWIFFNGALLASNYSFVAALWRRLPRWTKFAVLVGALTMFGYYVPLFALFGGNAYLVCLLRQGCTLSSMICMVVATQSRVVRHWLHQPLLLHLGWISYSAYLLHLTILLWIVHHYAGHLRPIYVIPGFIVAALVASEIFHTAVERPAMLLGRFAERRLAAWIQRTRFPKAQLPIQKTEGC